MVRQAELEAVFQLESVDCAELADLHYVTDAIPGITRRKIGDQFVYYDPQGKRITHEKILQRVKKLAIPPAYTDVWICPDPNGHLQATGRDAKGRKQYRYHARWSDIRNETKYHQMRVFGELLPTIRRQVRQDMQLDGMPQRKILAAVVKLLETTLIRIGNEEYAQKNHSYGLTTIKNRHVAVHGNHIHFEFKGKSGQVWNLDVEDRRLAGIVKRCASIPGHELFKYIDNNGDRHLISSTDVNRYLKELTGHDITAKFFRTWAGTVQAARLLQQFEPPTSQTRAKKDLVDVVKQVAQSLGNKPAICRKSYIHPAILDSYVEGNFLSAWEQALQQSRAHPQPELSEEEAALLVMLRSLEEKNA